MYRSWGYIGNLCTLLSVFIVNLKLILKIWALTGSSFRASWEGSGILLEGAPLSTGDLGSTVGTQPGAAEVEPVSQAVEEAGQRVLEGLRQLGIASKAPEPSGATRLGG